jgi:hypothetical protein
MGTVSLNTKASLFNDPTINPDLVISFCKDFNQNRYVWRLKNSSGKLAKLERHLIDLDITHFYTDTAQYTSPEEIIQNTFDRINSAKVRGNINTEIGLFGNELYDRLFPEQVKKIYWDYISPAKELQKISIIIKSDEPWIPWELIRPYHPYNRTDEGFWCENYNIARWLANSKLIDQINLSKVKLIAGPRLSAAELEITEIIKILKDKAERSSSDFDSVLALLKGEEEFSGLHFICHGEHNFTNAEHSELILQGGDLRPFNINGPYTRCGNCNSFVFLNACETGQISYALTGFGGWADAFVRRSNSCGFIGSMWEAEDELAYQFAVAFYANLLKGKKIGEAVRLARLHIKQIAPNDPTWLTYTLFANPLAKIPQNQLN